MASDRVTHTQYTVTDIEEIGTRLALGRRNGYASNREELFIGDMTIAAAVLDGERRPVGAVHVVAPTSRWTLAEARSAAGAGGDRLRAWYQQFDQDAGLKWRFVRLVGPRNRLLTVV